GRDELPLVAGARRERAPFGAEARELDLAAGARLLLAPQELRRAAVGPEDVPRDGAVGDVARDRPALAADVLVDQDALAVGCRPDARLARRGGGQAGERAKGDREGGEGRAAAAAGRDRVHGVL